MNASSIILHMRYLNWSFEPSFRALCAWLSSSLSSISYLQLLKISSEFISNIVSFPFVWFSSFIHLLEYYTTKNESMCLCVCSMSSLLAVAGFQALRCLPFSPSSTFVRDEEFSIRTSVYGYSFLVIYSCWRDASWHKQTTSKAKG